MYKITNIKRPLGTIHHVHSEETPPGTAGGFWYWERKKAEMKRDSLNDTLNGTGALNVVIRFDGQEYRVPGIVGRRAGQFDFDRDERQASYTDDKEDAIDTARYVFGSDIQISFRRVACADPSVN